MQNTTFDVVLTLDESGSISSSNFQLMKELSVDLVNKLADNDQISIYTFDDNIRKIIGFSNKKEAISAISNLEQHDGGTALYGAMNTAIKEFSNRNNSSSKIVIALTDGYDKRAEYLKPFTLTTILREQMLNLVEENEGVNIILKQSSRSIKKDKFSAFEYGLYYIKQEEDKKKRRKKRNIADMMFYTNG